MHNINSPAPVALGNSYTFSPSAFTHENPGGRYPKVNNVTGRVTYIHDAHRFFLVEYEIGGKHLRECIKF